jgi:glycosyltransferase involved in cell wall biosynthesis
VRVGISLLTFSARDLRAAESSVGQLLRAFERVGEHEYVVLVPAGEATIAGNLPVLEIADAPAVEKRSAAKLPLRGRSTRRTSELRAELRDVDVVHYPLTAPLPETDVPTVVTLADTQHRDLPEFLGPARRSFRRAAYDRGTRGADAIVVASEFVRRRAVSILDLDAARVHVVPLGIDHDVFDPARTDPERVLLYPARAWPHKNHARLFEAFAILRATRPQLRLVLTGSGHDRLGALPEGVETLGVVSPAELASLYRRAACTVFPSLYEGFATPPLEAMACGCPVAAANVAAIPEACGDAAVLFDPLDPEDIARAVVEADTRRDALRAKGFAQAARFTWDEVARALDGVYAVSSHVPALQAG